MFAWRERRRGKKGKERRAYRSLQTLHGSPPSHNNTTPSPLAATQPFPSPRTRRRRSSCHPRLRHCSFPRSFPRRNVSPRPTTFSLPRLCGLQLTGVGALSKVKLTPFLPPLTSSLVFSDLLLTEHRMLSLCPSFIPIFSGSFPFLLLVLRPRCSLSLSFSVSLFLSQFSQTFLPSFSTGSFS